MKKLLILLLAVFALTSCTNDYDVKEPFKIDPMAMVSLNPSKTGWNNKTSKTSKTNGEYLTPLRVVKEVGDISFYNYNVFKNEPFGRGFSGPQRDTISPKLKMWGTDIINMDGTLNTDFIEGQDLVLRRGLKYNVITKEYKLRVLHPDSGLPTDVLTINERETFDTIGYISNSIMREAERTIRIAHEANNQDEVYRIFNETFTFAPITGTEWRVLKSQGLQ